MLSIIVVFFSALQIFKLKLFVVYFKALFKPADSHINTRKPTHHNHKIPTSIPEDSHINTRKPINHNKKIRTSIPEIPHSQPENPH